MNIRKGDKVRVLSGDDRGDEGEVQRVVRAMGQGRRAATPSQRIVSLSPG
jgi:hypothetical protein